MRVACEALKPDDIADILVSSEGSILKQYREDFAGYGIDFSITPEAVKAISNLAYLEKTGARGLMTVLERTLRDYKFELPSSGIKSFELNTRTVENPKETLKELLVDNGDLIRDSMLADIEKFAASFREKTGFGLKLDDGAKRALVSESVENDKSVSAVCERVFKDFKHGLAIVSRNTGETEFAISADCVGNPDKFLSDMVVRSFGKKSNE